MSLASSSDAGEFKRLTGEYRLAGENFYDPPANEPSDTHIYFELRGATAADLFAKMKVKAQTGVCGDPSHLTKRIDQMQCTRSDGGKVHRCWFGVDIAKQKLVNGVVC